MIALARIECVTTAPARHLRRLLVSLVTTVFAASASLPTAGLARSSEIVASRAAEAAESARAREVGSEALDEMDARVQTWIEESDRRAARGDLRGAIEILDHGLLVIREARAGGSTDAVASNAALAALRGARGRRFLGTTSGDRARVELELARRLAAQAGARLTLATTANDLGNEAAARGATDEALEAYLEAERTAAAIGSRAIEIRALANAARTLVDAQRLDLARERVVRTHARLADWPRESDKLPVLLHWARTVARLVALRPEITIANAPAVLAASEALLEARSIASELGDARAASHAWGGLAELYTFEGRAAEALELYDRAIARAREADAPEVRYAWHAQAARVHARRGERDTALVHYAEAVALLETLRHGMGRGVGRGPSPRDSFRDSIGEIYFGYVDQLLRRAADSAEPAEDLRRAQETLEALKAAELRDYFRDECVDETLAQEVSAAEVSQRAAILYPVLLDDRIEILLTTASGIWRTSVPVTRAEATETLVRFRQLLEKRTTRQFLRPAQALYTWLVAPVVDRIDAAGIDALVFVPDGPLRAVPMAALHDGERFLVERFAIALTPGLRLTRPAPLDPTRARIFAGGVSEAVQGHAPLPFVAEELREVAAAFEGEVALDAEFRRDRIEHALATRAFSILHIASHASFDPNARDTYVLTHDDRMSMDDLASYVGLFRFRDQPLDLLMLSACETAAGDERAALGLSGLAVKAGARSAVGTLWPVNDQAASRLVARFYENLAVPDRSRAESLRAAQRSLIENPSWSHPAYWSAFVLISSWL